MKKFKFNVEVITAHLMLIAGFQILENGARAENVPSSEIQDFQALVLNPLFVFKQLVDSTVYPLEDEFNGYVQLVNSGEISMSECECLIAERSFDVNQVIMQAITELQTSYASYYENSFKAGVEMAKYIRTPKSYQSEFEDISVFEVTKKAITVSNTKTNSIFGNMQKQSPEQECDYRVFKLA